MLIRRENGMTEIDLIKCCEEVIKHLIIILLISALVAGGCYLYSAKTDNPTYRASGMMYVRPYGYVQGIDNLMEYSTNEANVNYANNSNYLEYMVNTCSKILSSRDTAESIIALSGVPYSVEQVQSMISSEYIAKTSALSYSVSCANENDALKIAKTISLVLPLKVNEIISDSDVVSIDKGNITASYVTKNHSKTALIGFFVAFFVLCAFVVLYGIFKESKNPLVHNEDELKCIYPETPVLNNFTTENKENLLLNDFKKKDTQVAAYHIWEENYPKQGKDGYRNVRSALLSSLDGDNAHHVLALTDCCGRDNNIDIATNLAYSLSLVGKKVLVIDTNFYDNAACPDAKGVSSEGLSDIILNDADYNSIIKTIDKNGHSFDLLACGNESDADEVLSSDAMAAFTGKIKEKYDIVIISFANYKYGDYVLCKSFLEGIMIVTANNAFYKDVSSCVEKIQMAGIKILGFIINN